MQPEAKLELKHEAETYGERLIDEVDAVREWLRTYGRMVLFTFESEYSAQELGAALDFAYSGGVDVSVTYKDILSKSKITAFILGGDAGTAVQTIDSYEALIELIKTGGNYSRQSPGAPIAYKLAYL